MATHSRDVLQGLLENASNRVTVVRLQRGVDGPPSVSVLPNDELRKAWSDPIIFHSRAIEGLFHRGVVLCEGDADCLFYGLVLSELESQTAGRPHDFVFTHAGGKHRFPIVIRSLRQLRVPIVAIADFDVLREKPLLDRILEGFGAERSSTVHFNQLDSALRTSTPKPKSQVEAEVTERLSSETQFISGQLSADLARIAKTETGWDKAKQAGQAAVPNGDPSSAATSLLQNSQAAGLFVVSVGEIERFVPHVPGHGPAWVAEVVESGSYRQSTAALDLVRQVASGLEQQISLLTNC